MSAMRISLDLDQVALLLTTFEFVVASNASTLVTSRFNAVERLIGTISHAVTELERRQIYYSSIECQLVDEVSVELIGMVSAIVSNPILKERFIESKTNERFEKLQDFNSSLMYAFLASRTNVATA